MNANKEYSIVQAMIDGDFAIDGGPGSGNFGHSGRPGEVGGSASGGGGSKLNDFIASAGHSDLPEDIDSILENMSTKELEALSEKIVNKYESLKNTPRKPGNRVTIEFGGLSAKVAGMIKNRYGKEK